VKPNKTRFEVRQQTEIGSKQWGVYDKFTGELVEGGFFGKANADACAAQTEVEKLRDVSGAGIQDAKRAVQWAKGDYWLALGYLKYVDAAVHVRPIGFNETYQQARERWVRQMATQYANEKRERRK
jgi:hypothetical protein